MTEFEWWMVGLTAGGFVLTGTGLLIGIGRAVEQMRASVLKDIEQEHDKVIEKIETLENKFDSDQKTQDHNFGEVGAAMRQYMADIEKNVREVEIYVRDNYVKIPDFEKAIDRLSTDFKTAVNDLKDDIRSLLKGLPN